MILSLDCGVMSYQALSPPQPLIRDVGSSLRQGGGGEREWQVELSRPPTQQQEEEGPFSPLMFSAPPAIPRIMELDVNHRRYWEYTCILIRGAPSVPSMLIRVQLHSGVQ